MALAHKVLARPSALKACPFPAAARHTASQISGRALLVLAKAHSVWARPCASKACTFAAAARRSESKTSGRTLFALAMAPRLGEQQRDPVHPPTGISDREWPAPLGDKSESTASLAFESE